MFLKIIIVRKYEKSTQTRTERERSLEYVNMHKLCLVSNSNLIAVWWCFLPLAVSINYDCISNWYNHSGLIICPGQNIRFSVFWFTRFWLVSQTAPKRRPHLEAIERQTLSQLLAREEIKAKVWCIFILACIIPLHKFKLFSILLCDFLAAELTRKSFS